MAKFKVGDVIKLDDSFEVYDGLIRKAEILKVHIHNMYEVNILEADLRGEFHIGVSSEILNFSTEAYVKEDYGFKKDLQDLLNE